MRLEKLIEEINEAVYKRIMENRTVSRDEARSTATMVGLAALRYDDLSNEAARIMSLILSAFIILKGNAGPYILYTMSESSPVSPSTGERRPGKPGCR